MRKKFASALIASLVLTQLTGCSLFQKVTAEDLVIDGFNTLANAESYDLDMELIVGVKAEVEEGVNMDMGINADINIEGEEDITHFKGDMGIEFMGMSMTEELESWVEVDGDTTYTYDYSAEDDAWYVSEEDTEDEDEDKVEFDEDSLDIFTNLTLEERESKKDDYVVTALIDMDEIKDLLEEFGDTSSLDELEDLGIDTGSDDFELGFAMEMTFDADSKEIKTLKLDIDGDAVSVDGVEFKEFAFELKFNSFNEELELKVPKSVKNDALEAPSADDFDWGLDEEYTYDDEDYTYDDDEYTYDDDEDIMDIIDDLETDVIVDPVEDEPEYNKPVASADFSNDWTDLQIMIDGVMYDVPFDYDKLVAAGYSFDLADYGYEDGYEMKPGDKVTGTIELTNPKFGDNYNSFAPWVGFINETNETKDITECAIWSIRLENIHGSKLMESYPSIELINGITWGSTADELLETFGEPQDTYYSESLGYTSYTFYSRDKEAKIDYYARFTVYDNYGLTAVEYEFF